MLTKTTNKTQRMAAYKVDLFAEIKILEASLVISGRHKTFSMLLNALLLVICTGLLFIIAGGFIAISVALAVLAIFLAFILLGFLS